jgi:Fe-S-cluster containining protein
LRVILPDRNVTDAFPETGSHWRLATTEMGQCVFLGESGCVLERGLRPFYCRLFPFWLYQEQLTWFTAEECLAAAECASSAAMLRAMDLSMDEIRELFRAMCAALDLHTR